MKVQSLLPKAQKFEVKLPTGEATGVVFTVVGQDSAQFKSAAKAFAQRQLDAKDKRMDVESMDKQRIEMAAVCLTDWSGLDDEFDQPLAFSKEAAISLLSNPGLGYLVDEIERFVTERANFFRPQAAGTSEVGSVEG